MHPAKQLFGHLAAHLEVDARDLFLDWLDTACDTRLNFRMLADGGRRHDKLAAQLYREEEEDREPKFFRFFEMSDLMSLNECVFSQNSCFVIYDVTLPSGPEMIFDPRAFNAFGDPETKGGEVKLALTYDRKTCKMEVLDKKDAVKADRKFDLNRFGKGVTGCSPGAALGLLLGRTDCDDLLNLHDIVEACEQFQECEKRYVVCLKRGGFFRVETT